tara:strand:+ start:10233 stop:10637 length:405 start_codon:yes stop_codon:yes gene_type:complete
MRESFSWISTIYQQSPEPIQFILFQSYLSNMDLFQVEGLLNEVLERIQDDESASETMPILWQSDYIKITIEDIGQLAIEYGAGITVRQAIIDDVLQPEACSAISTGVQYALFHDADMIPAAVHYGSGVNPPESV